MLEMFKDIKRGFQNLFQKSESTEQTVNTSQDQSGVPVPTLQDTTPKDEDLKKITEEAKRKSEIIDIINEMRKKTIKRKNDKNIEQTTYEATVQALNSEIAEIKKNNGDPEQEQLLSDALKFYESSVQSEIKKAQDKAKETNDAKRTQPQPAGEKSDSEPPATAISVLKSNFQNAGGTEKLILEDALDKLKKEQTKSPPPAPKPEEIEKELRENAIQTARETQATLTDVLKQKIGSTKNDVEKSILNTMLQKHQEEVDKLVNEIKTKSPTSFLALREFRKRQSDAKTPEAKQVLFDAREQWKKDAQDKIIEDIRKEAGLEKTKIEDLFKTKIKSSTDKKQIELLGGAFNQWKTETANEEEKSKTDMIAAMIGERIDDKGNPKKDSTPIISSLEGDIKATTGENQRQLLSGALEKYKLEIKNTIYTVSKEAKKKYPDLSKTAATKHLFEQKIKNEKDPKKRYILSEAQQEYISQQEKLKNQTETDENIDKGFEKIWSERIDERRIYQEQYDKAIDATIKNTFKTMLEEYDKKTQEMIRAETSKRIEARKNRLAQEQKDSKILAELKKQEEEEPKKPKTAQESEDIQIPSGDSLFDDDNKEIDEKSQESQTTEQSGNDTTTEGSEYNILFKGNYVPDPSELTTVKDDDDYDDDDEDKKEEKNKKQQESKKSNQELCSKCFKNIRPFGEIKENIDKKIKNWAEQIKNEAKSESLKTEREWFRSKENIQKQQTKSQLLAIAADLVTTVNTLNGDNGHLLELFQPKNDTTKPNFAYITAIVRYVEGLSSALTTAKTSLESLGMKTKDIEETITALHSNDLRTFGRTALLNSDLFKLAERGYSSSSRKSKKITKFQTMARALARTGMNIFSALSYYKDHGYDWNIADKRVTALMELAKDIERTSDTDTIKKKMKKFWTDAGGECLNDPQNAPSNVGQLLDKLKELKEVMLDPDLDDDKKEAELRKEIQQWNKINNIPRVKDKDSYATTIFEAKDQDYLWQYEPDKERQNKCLQK